MLKETWKSSGDHVFVSKIIIVSKRIIILTVLYYQSCKLYMQYDSKLKKKKKVIREHHPCKNITSFYSPDGMKLSIGVV